MEDKLEMLNSNLIGLQGSVQNLSAQTLTLSEKLTALRGNLETLAGKLKEPGAEESGEVVLKKIEEFLKKYRTDEKPSAEERVAKFIESLNLSKKEACVLIETICSRESRKILATMDAYKEMGAKPGEIKIEEKNKVESIKKLIKEVSALKKIADDVKSANRQVEPAYFGSHRLIPLMINISTAKINIGNFKSQAEKNFKELKSSIKKKESDSELEELVKSLNVFKDLELKSFLDVFTCAQQLNDKDLTRNCFSFAQNLLETANFVAYLGGLLDKPFQNELRKLCDFVQYAINKNEADSLENREIITTLLLQLKARRQGLFAIYIFLNNNYKSEYFFQFAVGAVLWYVGQVHKQNNAHAYLQLASFCAYELYKTLSDINDDKGELDVSKKLDNVVLGGIEMACRDYKAENEEKRRINIGFKYPDIVQGKKLVFDGYLDATYSEEFGLPIKDNLLNLCALHRIRIQISKKRSEFEALALVEGGEMKETASPTAVHVESKIVGMLKQCSSEKTAADAFKCAKGQELDLLNSYFRLYPLLPMGNKLSLDQNQQLDQLILIAKKVLDEENLAVLRDFFTNIPALEIFVKFIGFALDTQKIKWEDLEKQIKKIVERNEQLQVSKIKNLFILCGSHSCDLLSVLIVVQFKKEHLPISFLETYKSIQQYLLDQRMMSSGNNVSAVKSAISHLALK
jgi:hypothetical protein